uniref:hypothetical protein n=1 Tax=Parerythrobacter lutipelagi TaxID=1964208 RepID=UPI0010F59454|nr:hypothetical protein [Parerythrobacter lutipelagi]
MADQNSNNEEIHIEDDDAMAGEKSGRMRWVLGVGLLFAVIAMSLVWIIPAAMQGDAEEEATVSGAADAMAENNPMLSETEAAEQIAGDEDPLEVGEERAAGEQAPEPQ